MSKQNKSVSRRRSRSLVGFVSRDLCKTVPKSLPPSERLMMLLEQSFQYALSVVQKDVMLKEEFDIGNFRQNGTKCWEKIKAIIEENDLVKSAVDVNGLCDSYVEAKVEECNESIALVEAESEKWSKKISHYRECLKKEIDSSYSLYTSGLEMKNQYYDYSDILAETSAIERNISQQVQDLESARKTIEDCVDIHKSCHIALQQKCTKCYHKNISRTPRTIIRRLASSRNMKPYDING